MDEARVGRGGLPGRMAAALFASVLALLLVHAALPGLGGERFLVLARAIVRDGTVILGERPGLPGSPWVYGNDELVWEGHVVLNTNPGYSFLLVPGEVLACALRKGESRFEMLLALAALPLPLAALAVVALADLAARTTGKVSSGLLAGAIFLFGTPQGVLSCCLNQNSTLCALLVLSLASAVFPRGNVLARAALAGALAGTAFLVDVSAVFFAALVAAHVARSSGVRALAAFGAGFALLAAVMLPYDEACFGRPFALPNAVFVEAWKLKGQTVDVPPGPHLLTPSGVFYGLLSWRGGLLCFCPFVVPAIHAGARAARASFPRKEDTTLLALALTCAAVGYGIVNASWQHLELVQNTIFGPRYQLWGLPLAALLFVSGKRSCLSWATAAWSLVVCASGLMYPPPIPSGCAWRFYQSAVLVLVSGPRSPLACSLPSSEVWYGYDTRASTGLGLEVLAIGLVLLWVRAGFREAAREAVSS
ncbi:hypothetical protein HY251_14680 [bacterium]|nr:hypothetical protein [bacterium]